MKKVLTPKDYESLADLRHHLGELAVYEVGLEPRQHQLMLALKGLPRGTRPRIGELPERLAIQHHSAVGLVDRLASERVLRELSLYHRAELRKEGPALFEALQRVMRSIENTNGRDTGLPDRSGEQVRHVGPQRRTAPSPRQQ